MSSDERISCSDERGGRRVQLIPGIVFHRNPAGAASVTENVPAPLAPWGTVEDLQRVIDDRPLPWKAQCLESF
jgi:hypothetical protein